MEHSGSLPLRFRADTLETVLLASAVVDVDVERLPSSAAVAVIMEFLRQLALCPLSAWYKVKALLHTLQLYLVLGRWRRQRSRSFCLLLVILYGDGKIGVCGSGSGTGTACIYQKNYGL
ncbi:hypothetical protein Adt_22252 [Abeliophyllum distichum]|uniref:Uncharacterized protein n=1 Tax=Abeliophyllum distichum TaxID=126358 RepID=A0ABD1T1Q4_9LAMI